jgi:hypothetical protein
MTAPFDLRPAGDEYAPYYGRYIELVPPGDVLAALEQQMHESQGFLAEVGEQRSLFRYARGKWSIKQVVGHLIDVERVFAYRAMRFARGDGTPLPGIEQDDLVENADFDLRPLASLLLEWEHVRRANMALFASFDLPTLVRRGMASECEFSVRAAIFIIAGHELHHLEILRTRYAQR